VVTGERALPPGVAVVPAELTLLTSMFLHGDRRSRQRAAGR
jgi:hypothetical protein